MDGDLGVGGVARWIAGLAAAALVVSMSIALLSSRVSRHRLGVRSVLLSLVFTVSCGVVAVVLWRAKDGDATGYDWLWAGGLAVVGWLAARRLWRRPAIVVRPARSRGGP